MIDAEKIEICPFCRLDISDISFLENENFLVVYNIAPILPGHSLVIPKKHTLSLFELNQEELKDFMVLGQKAGRLLSKAFNVESFNWSIQERAPAGQSVPHLHMHVIPRKEGDLSAPGDWYPELEDKFYSNHIDSSERPKFNREQLKSIAKKLREIGQNL
ncbi:hypothetical protein GCM10028808_73580 [Spirosoma migulaei]|uniref:HIT family protein n=1 Tax=Spirosoma foliorum TaxID=2710596 RepID=A0A7G5H6E3_9BACT|nr:HIT family protein [Spirosoma foliorum]QMW06685.1 HIT family protein [Spirosoma foliorum]